MFKAILFYKSDKIQRPKSLPLKTEILLEVLNKLNRLGSIITHV